MIANKLEIDGNKIRETELLKGKKFGVMQHDVLHVSPEVYSLMKDRDSLDILMNILEILIVPDQATIPEIFSLAQKELGGDAGAYDSKLEGNGLPANFKYCDIVYSGSYVFEGKDVAYMIIRDIIVDRYNIETYLFKGGRWNKIQDLGISSEEGDYYLANITVSLIMDKIDAIDKIKK